MYVGRCARETFSLLLATFTASMTLITAHKERVSCGRIGSSLGRQGGEAGDGPYALVLGSWCPENGVEFGHLKHTRACFVKCR